MSNLKWAEIIVGLRHVDKAKTHVRRARHSFEKAGTSEIADVLGSIDRIQATVDDGQEHILECLVNIGAKEGQCPA